MTKNVMLALLAAGAGALAACSGVDTPTAIESTGLRPRLAVNDLTTSTPVVGQVKVCKTGNSGGTFTVTRTAIGASTGTVQNPATVATGECRVVAEDFGPSGVGSNVKVLETSAGFQSASFTRTDAAGTTTYVNGTTEVFVNSVHGVTITFVNRVDPVVVGCTYTQGWYKNKGAGTLPAGNFFGSGQTYLGVLNTPPKGGNVYYQLAHQYIAASLNKARPSSSTAAVDAALAGALAYFGVATPSNSVPAGYTSAQLGAWATTLDQYNNGIIGPGHCD